MRYRIHNARRRRSAKPFALGYDLATAAARVARAAALALDRVVERPRGRRRDGGSSRKRVGRPRRAALRVARWPRATSTILLEPARPRDRCDRPARASFSTGNLGVGCQHRACVAPLPRSEPSASRGVDRVTDRPAAPHPLETTRRPAPGALPPRATVATSARVVTLDGNVAGSRYTPALAPLRALPRARHRRLGVAAAAGAVVIRDGPRTTRPCRAPPRAPAYTNVRYPFSTTRRSRPPDANPSATTASHSTSTISRAGDAAVRRRSRGRGMSGINGVPRLDARQPPADRVRRVRPARGPQPSSRCA